MRYDDEYDASWMPVRNFARAMLAALVLGAGIGGMVGYGYGRHGAYQEGIKDEERAVIDELASDQPCVNALQICYPELKSATSYAEQGFFKARPK